MNFKERMIDYWFTPGKIILLLAIMIVGLTSLITYEQRREREKYIDYCTQDPRLTREDCYWKYELNKPKSTVTSMPIIIPTR